MGYLDVAKTLKKLLTSKGDYCISIDSLQSRPFSKWELFLKERICSKRSEFFPLRAVSLGMENHF